MLKLDTKILYTIEEVLGARTDPAFIPVERLSGHYKPPPNCIGAIRYSYLVSMCATFDKLSETERNFLLDERNRSETNG